MSRPEACTTTCPRLPARPAWRRLGGFTTTELLVTLSIVGTVSALAAPSMTSALRRSMISAAANDLQGAVNRARIEAQRAGGAGVPFSVCASSQSTTPSTSTCTGSWNQGTIVFADRNGNGARDAGEEVVLALPPMDGSVSVSLKSTLPYVLFAPNGMLHGGETGLRFTITHSRVPQQSDVQHLCVLRSGVEVVADTALQTDSRHARCKAL